MMHASDLIGLAAAFLLTLPPRSERPPGRPNTRKPDRQAQSQLSIFVVLLLMSAFPIAWAMNWRDEATRASCEASGGQIVRVPLSISYVDRCER